MVNDDNFVTIEEIADKLKVDLETVRNWLRKGTLKGYKFGKFWRVKESDFEEFLQKAQEH